MAEYQEKRFAPNNKPGLRRREFIGGIVSVTAASVLSPQRPASAAREASGNTYREVLETPIVGRYQVIVAGGGPSGLIAALAAARSGANTLLIERYGFLGGNGTAGLMTCYNGFRNQRPPEQLQTVKGITAEYIAEIVRLGGLADSDNYAKQFPHDVRKGDLPYCIGFDPEAAKIAALNMIKKDGVTLAQLGRRPDAPGFTSHGRDCTVQIWPAGACRRYCC